MTALPRVSVVVPCYNAEAYVGATLRSILAQDSCELEIIVVDDGSSDRSAAVVERDFPDVRLLKLANGGVAAARNAGIACATGDWIAFCDADDIWLPGKLAAQFQAMQAAPDSCRMSYTAWHVWISVEPEPAPDLVERLSAEPAGGPWAGATGWLYPELLLDCEVWTSTVLMHRSLIDEIGVFDTSLRLGEDYDLWLRASRLSRIERVARPLALYRKHSASITRSVQTANYRGNVVQSALDRWGYAGPDGRRADETAVRRVLAKSWSDFASAQLSVGQVRAARASVRESLRQYPAHLAGWKLLLRSLLPSRRG